VRVKLSHSCRRLLHGTVKKTALERPPSTTLRFKFFFHACWQVGVAVVAAPPAKTPNRPPPRITMLTSNYVGVRESKKILEQPHNFLGKPNVFVGVNSFHTACTTSGQKREIFRSRRAHHRDGGGLLGATAGTGLLFVHGIMALLDWAEGEGEDIARAMGQDRVSAEGHRTSSESSARTELLASGGAPISPKARLVATERPQLAP
jgi:hypothetical protein